MHMVDMDQRGLEESQAGLKTRRQPYRSCPRGKSVTAWRSCRLMRMMGTTRGSIKRY